MMKYNNGNSVKKQVLQVFFTLFSIYMIFLYCIYPILMSKGNSNHIITNEASPVYIKSSSLLDLCHQYDIDQLSSLIWSHRASISSSSLSSSSSPSSSSSSSSSSSLHDGTLQSLTHLLDNGITNFDIDVSIKEKAFIVAHPSQLSSSSSSSSSIEYISINTFLNTINNHMKIIQEQHEKSLNELDDKALLSYKDNRRVIDTIPFITIEPKFNNDDNEFDKNIKALVDVLIDSPLSNNVAVIATTTTIEKILHKIIPETSGIRIARAYRSIPVKHGHIWKNNINNNKKKNDHIKILHMPDKSLITKDIKRKNTDDIDNNEMVISWLCDDEEKMWDLFDKGSDAIISNKPIELLSILKRNYEQRC